MAMSWEARAEDKRLRLGKNIPADWRIDVTKLDISVFGYPATSSILTSQELEITNSSAVDLVAKLATGQVKSVTVTLAFCKRAAIAHQLVNCALEFFPEAALAQAKELDLCFEKTGKPVGALHGLPISLKDQLRIKGLETSMGYVAWLGKYEKDDSVLTSLLRKAGAVFYVKTSVPQSLMVCETFNNIIGRTVNPRNKNWSCGGSSGGEGAIVGLRGGVIGVGTDIGGSIRVPAAFNFLYGLRPSHGRLPYAKMANSMEGQETIHSVCGPITHSIADMRLFTKAVLQLQDIRSALSLSGEPQIPNIDDLVIPGMPSKDLNEAWDIQLKKWELQCEYLEQLRTMEEKLGVEMDAFIAPITPTAAIRHNQFKYYGYASAINFLDFTSVVVPVLFADKEIDKARTGYKPLNKLDEIVQAEYDPEAYDGAPVAVQIVGRRLTEEKTMAIAEEIGKLLGNMTAS